MMRERFFLCLFLLLVIRFGSLGALFGQPSSHQTFSEAQKDSVRSLLKPFPSRVQAAVGLYDSGRTRFYGIERTEKGFKEVSNADSIFRIGSFTKVFTATLFMDAMRDGKLALDDTIWDEMDIRPKVDTPITYRHLITHTSGLPKLPSGFGLRPGFDPKNPYKGFGDRELENYIQERIQVQSAPGKSYHYSNLVYGILGYILRKASGRSYKELVQGSVVDPYGLEHTGVPGPVSKEKSGTEPGMKKRAVQGLDRKGGSTPYWDFASMKGAGVVFSTARDMLRFAKANFDTSNTLLQRQQKILHRVQKEPDMAYGWHVRKGPEMERWHWHNGATGGFRCSLVMNADQKEAVVVLANISGLHKQAGRIDRLSYVLLRSL